VIDQGKQIMGVQNFELRKDKVKEDVIDKN
jgi:hypothetical protein